MRLLNLLAIFQLLTAPSWRSRPRRLACSGHRKPARGRWERRVWRGWLGAADMMMMVMMMTTTTVVVLLLLLLLACLLACFLLLLLWLWLFVVIVAVSSTEVSQGGELQP